MTKEDFKNYKTSFEQVTGKKENEYQLSDLLSYIKILKMTDIKTDIKHYFDTVMKHLIIKR